MTSARGFTLVELMIWAGLVGIVMWATLTVLNAGTRAYLFGAARVEVQQDSRGELEPILRVIRQASFVLDADLMGFELMAPDGMRVRFNMKAPVHYAGGHGEPEEVLRANPTLIRSITVTLGPFQGTATLRNQRGSSYKEEPDNCVRGTYGGQYGDWNLFCN